MGWMLKMGEPERMRYAPDIARDPMLRSISRNFRWFMVGGLLIPGVIAAAIVGISTGSWLSALIAYGLGVVWGGFARVFFVHHITWSVNSICHVWGSTPYESHDESRNNPIVGVLAFGEGWHNNHHAFPTSARHGLAWWQFDLSYVIIKGLSYVGMTWDVKVPDAERRAAKRKQSKAA
jgi:stearoyl-CoA desaturase (delta-9 desaturase)